MPTEALLYGFINAPERNHNVLRDGALRSTEQARALMGQLGHLQGSI